MWECRRESHNNILSALKFTATVKLQKQNEAREGPSAEKPHFCTDDPTSGRSARSKRQTSGEVSRINYCRGINHHAAEMYNTSFVRKEHSPPPLRKCRIRQDLHTDKSCLYYFFPRSKRIAIIIKIYGF